MVKFPSISKKQRPKKPGKWQHLKTIAFLVNPCMFKNTKSVFSDTALIITALDSSQLQASAAGELALEMASEAVRSKRLFFEPGSTNSFLEPSKMSFDESVALASDRPFFEPEKTNSLREWSKMPFADCVALAVDTADPVAEFRQSMEEIADLFELKEWEDLEELLARYLRVNGEKNHVFIVGAFIDFVGSASVFSYGSAGASAS